MQVYIILLCVAYVASQNVETSKQSPTFPKGDPRLCLQTDTTIKLPTQRFEALPGTGWDNLQNKPKGQINQFTYTKCLTTDDGRFLVPDQVFTIPIKESKVDTYAELIDNWHNTSSVTSDSVNVNGGLGLGFFSVSGSFSWEHTEIKKKQIEDKASTVRVQLRYLRYKSLLQPDSRFHPNFKKRLLSIAVSLQLNKTQMAHYEGELLVRDYGTHFLTSITAGAALVKTDFLKKDYVASQSKDKTKILESASASYCGFFGISESYSHTVTKTDKELYEKSRTHAYVQNYGGPLMDPAKPNISQWTAGIDGDLVAMDRSGDPLSFLITEEALPELPVNIVFQLQNVVRRSIVNYYKMNTYSGCTNFNSPNFSPVANYDDGTCAKEATNMTFGGTYQTCTVVGSYLSKNPCTGMTQKNPKTADFRCPNQYTPVELITGTKLGQHESQRNCHSCGFLGWSTCCDTKNYQATAKYTTYWCAATGHVNTDSGYLFGGLYSDSQENPLTGTKGCPHSFYSLRFMNRHICLSDDFEVGRPDAAQLGGFFSCKMGNPLAVPGVKPVGLNSAPVNSLAMFMANHDTKTSWPKHCPTGYSQHLAVINGDCEVSYCLKSGTFSGTSFPNIKLPPYEKPPQSIPAGLISTVFNPKLRTWTREDPDKKQSAAQTSGSDEGGLGTGGAAAIGVVATLAVIAIIVGAVFVSRRKLRYPGAQRLRPSSEERIHNYNENSGDYGATSPSTGVTVDDTVA